MLGALVTGLISIGGSAVSWVVGAGVDSLTSVSWSVGAKVVSWARGDSVGEKVGVETGPKVGANVDSDDGAWVEVKSSVG